MTNRVRAIDVAAKFHLRDDEIESRLMQACAKDGIASWAGRAVFNEGEKSHEEVDWRIPPEAWINPDVHSPRIADQGGTSLSFCLREGTLRGKGFSPYFFRPEEPTIVDTSTINFSLTKLEFDADDLAYYFEGRPEKNDATNSARSSAVPSDSPTRLKASVGAKPSKIRWEQFAAGFVVLWDRGELDVDSEAEIHKRVATYLAKRGHTESLGIDTVRSLIRRVKTWANDHPYNDDAPPDS